MCSPWEDLTRRPGTAKPVMCSICFEWTALDDLETDSDGTKWDICKTCAVQERKYEGLSPYEIQKLRNAWKSK